jgi:hypothetical protein
VDEAFDLITEPVGGRIVIRAIEYDFRLDEIIERMIQRPPDPVGQAVNLIASLPQRGSGALNIWRAFRIVARKDDDC